MYEKCVLGKSEEINEELIKIRRDIHSHPELGLQEIRTSQLVADKLRELGIEVKKGMALTGVVGLLRGSGEGKTIMLRADMDCLRLQENNDVSYKSEYPGLMHGCGHDVHTTWLLGAAMILSEMKDKLKGNVKFVFQPAEEFSGGASLMIEGGVLQNPKVDAAVGAHIWPYINTGKVGVKEGSIMAASDSFKLTITGKGGHGGHPHKCIDPIASACEIYMAFQTIVSRRVNPMEPAVITIGKFNAGTAHNVIPDEVVLEGTVRTLTHETRDLVPELMKEIAEGITIANGAKYKFEYTKYHPPVINDGNITNLIEISAGEIIGKENVLRMERPTMAGEDFSFYQTFVPAAFFWIGTGDKEMGTDNPLHSSDFKVDENMIHKGSAILAQCALNFLK